MSRSAYYGAHHWVLVIAAASLFVMTVAHAAMRTQKVDANGFTMPIAQGAAGPYEYVMGIWPPDPGVGDLHISIVVTSDQRPVTDAVVEVWARVAHQTGTVGPFRTENYFQPWDYELDLFLGEPGDWTFDIEINSPLGDAAIEVPLQVSSQAQDLPKAPEDQEPAKLTEGSESALGGATDGKGFNWVIVAAPLAIVGLGAAAWALRNRRPEIKPAGLQRLVRRSRRRGR